MAKKKVIIISFGVRRAREKALAELMPKREPTYSTILGEDGTILHTVIVPASKTALFHKVMDKAVEWAVGEIKVIKSAA